MNEADYKCCWYVEHGNIVGGIEHGKRMKPTVNVVGGIQHGK